VAELSRGGGSLAPRVQAVAQISSVLGVANGLVFLFFTERLGRPYGFPAEAGSQPRFVHQAVGAIVLGQGISLHLVLIQNASPLKAIGAALLPRLALSFYCLLRGQRLSFVGSFLKMNTALMTWVCLSVLTGVGNPAVAAKTFTTFAVFKGSFLALAPVAASKKFFETDVTTNKMERVHFQALGEHLTYSAVYMAALAYGVPPATAAGAAVAVWASLIVALHYGRLDCGYGEVLPNRKTERAYLGAAVLLAVGFLWPSV